MRIYVVVQDSVCFQDSLQNWLANHEIEMPEGDITYSEPEGLHLREIKTVDERIIFGNDEVARKGGIKVGTWKISSTMAGLADAYLVFPDFSTDV